MIKISIVSKGTTTTEGIETYANEKLGKLEKYIPDSTIRLVCNIKSDGRHKAEVTVNQGKSVLHAEASSDSLYSSIDLVEEKLQSILRKYKEKKISVKRKAEKKHAAAEKATIEQMRLAESEEPQTRIAKEKTHILVSLTPEEAIDESIFVGHDKYIFLNSDDNKIAMVYKREDGSYGLIHFDVEE